MDLTPQQARRPRFDGTINLGHIIQVLVIVGGLWIVLVKAEVRTANLETRIQYLEAAQRDIGAAISKLGDAQALMARGQERMATSLEYLTKGK